MARFILDVMTEDIERVLDVIDRDKFLSSGVTTIVCIDETNDNQFYHHDTFMRGGKRVVHTPMMNQISDKQIKEFNEFLNKC